MESLAALRFLGSLIAPPRCAVCGAAVDAGELVCPACAGELTGAGSGAGVLAGLGSVSWAAPYAGVARELVAALKFGGRIGLADLAAAAITGTVPPLPEGWAVVAVPAAPLRRRRRGFDPAEAIAARVAARLSLPIVHSLARSNGRRQVGRPRRERLASPPRIRATAAAPARALIVDDVLTTGATLAAVAAALRDAGCLEFRAAVFAKALGGERFEA